MAELEARPPEVPKELPKVEDPSCKIINELYYLRRIRSMPLEVLQLTSKAKGECDVNVANFGLLKSQLDLLKAQNAAREAAEKK